MTKIRRTTAGKPLVRRQRRWVEGRPDHQIMLSNRKKRNRAAARVARKARRISRRSRR